MKFQKLGLISAAAVLASMVSAGAYTHPAPVVPTSVGNLDGLAFYVGGALSSLGGSARNQSFTTGSAAASANKTASTSLVAGSTYAVTPDALNAFSLTTTSSDITSTVNALKFGGEGHLGAYVGVTEGFGISLEAFGVTRTSFNPVSTVTVADVSTSTSSALTAPVSATTGTSTAGSNPVGNTVTTGLDISPKSMGYGFRVQPTVMLSDDYGVYASVGYGSQKWEGTLTNSEFFQITNQYNANTATSAYASGTTGSAGQAISKTLKGMNYGVGSIFNIDETISVYSAVEVQKFSTYSVNAVGSTVASTTIPTTATAQVGASTAVQTMFTGGATSIVDAGTTATPSAIKLQLNTYSVGIDYTFA